MAKFNLKKLLATLALVQQNLLLLEQVIDVDRLVGISNAQGPLAKQIQHLLLEAGTSSQDLSGADSRLSSGSEVPPRVLGGGVKKTKSKRKKTTSSSGGG